MPRVARHRSLARVVGGHGKVDASLVPGEQPLEQSRARGHVLAGIEAVGHPEPAHRTGHELHEAAGAARRHRERIELGLGLDDGADEIAADPVFARGLVDDALDVDGFGRGGEGGQRRRRRAESRVEHPIRRGRHAGLRGEREKGRGQGRGHHAASSEVCDGG